MVSLIIFHVTRTCQYELFYRWENERSKLLSSLPKATRLVGRQTWDSNPGLTQSKPFFTFQHALIPGCFLLFKRRTRVRDLLTFYYRNRIFFPVIPVNYGTATETFLEAPFLEHPSSSFCIQGIYLYFAKSWTLPFFYYRTLFFRASLGLWRNCTEITEFDIPLPQLCIFFMLLFFSSSIPK